MSQSLVPLRRRLTIWYALILALGLGLFALSLWLLARWQLEATVDRALYSRVKDLGRYLEHETNSSAVDELREELREFAAALPEGQWMDVRDEAGTALLTSGMPMPAESSPQFGYVEFRGRPYRTVHTSIKVRGLRYEVFAASSLEIVQQLLTQLGWLLLCAMPGVLAVASFGGYWLSRRALAPVAQMTAAAQEIGIANLSHRLTVPPSRDELQQLAETWNGMLARLEAAVNRLAQFTADASHELRTPIALIRTTAELALRRMRTPEEYREALTRIQAESATMTQLVEDLLALARADAHADRLPLSAVDLPIVLREVADLAGRAASDKSVRFAANVESEPCVVLGHAAALRRLVWALVENAVKYTPSGGQVWLTLHVGPDEAVIEVRDTGIGMTPEVQAHIFERFYRADPARGRDTAGGHGLGLSLAREIAEQHGAELRVESEAGRGSMFRVVLTRTSVSTAAVDAA